MHSLKTGMSLHRKLTVGVLILDTAVFVAVLAASLIGPLVSRAEIVSGPSFVEWMFLAGILLGIFALGFSSGLATSKATAVGHVGARLVALGLIWFTIAGLMLTVLILMPVTLALLGLAVTKPERRLTA